MEKNVQAGIELGLDSILMAHNHNINNSTNIPRAQNWKDIYNRIVHEEKYSRFER